MPEAAQRPGGTSGLTPRAWVRFLARRPVFSRPVLLAAGLRPRPWVRLLMGRLVDPPVLPGVGLRLRPWVRLLLRQVSQQRLNSAAHRRLAGQPSSDRSEWHHASGRRAPLLHLGNAARSLFASVLAGAVVITVVAVPVTRADAASGVPAYDHIFVVVLGGHPLTDMVGRTPFLTRLAASGGVELGYQAPSADPVSAGVAVAAGQIAGLAGCLPAACSQGGSGLGGTVDASGRTWKAYAEAMPAACSTTPAGNYTPMRVPWLYLAGLATECPQRVVPYTALASDLAAAATTPNLVWVVPDLQDGMVSGTVEQGDAWLAAAVPALQASPAWTTQRSLLVVVGDTGTAGVPVQFVAAASDGSIPAGLRSTRSHTGYDLLATVESAWGLPSLTPNDASATPLTDLFAAPATTSAVPTPSPSGTGTAPSPTPTATASGGPGSPPTTGGTASPSPTGPTAPTASPASAGASPNAIPGAPLPAGTGASVRVLIAAPTPGSAEFTLSTPAMDVVNLVYVGPTTISSGGIASLPVLEFTATSLTMTSGGSLSDPSLTMQTPCIASVGTTLSHRLTAPAGGTATFSGGLTLYVSSMDFTYLGVPTSLLASAPPVAFATIATGQLTGVTTVAARVSAPSESLPAMQSVAYFGC